MKRSVLILLMICALAGQTQSQTQPGLQDTARGSMPMLEIPEITIVGKKAITLPFARKGEIFDINIFEPPPPDSSFMLSRPRLPLPVGEYNRLAERVTNTRTAVRGGYGSNTMFDLGLNFSTMRGNWDIYSGINFFSSGYSPLRARLGSPVDGEVTYTPNDNYTLSGEIGTRTLIVTDNDLLKNLRLHLDAAAQYDAYPVGRPGLFYRDEAERERTGTRISGGIGSVQRTGFVFDMELSNRSWSVTRNDQIAILEGSPASISAVEPKLSGDLAIDVGRFRLASDLRFESSALDYSYPTQSPSLFALSAQLQWQLMDRWYIAAGIGSGYGSASDGGSRTLFLPSARLRWEIDSYREFTAWWEPEMRFISYDSLVRLNPFLQSELTLRPQRVPVNLGAAFSFDSRVMSFRITGTYRQSSNRPVIISDRLLLGVGYLDAIETVLEANGSFTFLPQLRVSYSGTLQRSVPDTGDVQLPMTPGLMLSAKGEYDLPRLPITVYAKAAYRGKQNTELTGPASIDPYVTMDAGVSTSVIPSIVLSLDLLNLTGTQYQWWDGYLAPGFQFYLSMKAALQ